MAQRGEKSVGIEPSRLSVDNPAEIAHGSAVSQSGKQTLGEHLMKGLTWILKLRCGGSDFPERLRKIED